MVATPQLPASPLNPQARLEVTHGYRRLMSNAPAAAHWARVVMAPLTGTLIDTSTQAVP